MAAPAHDLQGTQQFAPDTTNAISAGEFLFILNKVQSGLATVTGLIRTRIL